MLDQLGARAPAVELAERPGEAGARRRERLEAGRLEQPGGADVPGVRHHEQPVTGMQLPEAGSTIGSLHGLPDGSHPGSLSVASGRQPPGSRRSTTSPWPRTRYGSAVEEPSDRRPPRPRARELPRLLRISPPRVAERDAGSPGRRHDREAWRQRRSRLHAATSTYPRTTATWSVTEGLPPGAEELRRRLLASDAFVIASPEYNASMPGLLKNAIDWVSRSRPQPFHPAPRPVALRLAVDGRRQSGPLVPPGAARAPRRPDLPGHVLAGAGAHRHSTRTARSPILTLQRALRGPDRRAFSTWSRPRSTTRASEPMGRVSRRKTRARSSTASSERPRRFFPAQAGAAILTCMWLSWLG